MSSQYGRLCMARDRAHPITPTTRIEVYAADLDAVLAHYSAMFDEVARLKGALAFRDNTFPVRAFDTCGDVRSSRPTNGNLP